MEPPPIEVTPKTIRSKEALYYGSSEPKVTASDKIPVKLKGHGDSALVKQNPVNNTPSNVRNMITAFESSLNQVCLVYCFKILRDRTRIFLLF